MVSQEALVQLKAFARQDGAILAVVWLASMWCLFKWTESTWGPLLMLSTPFFIVWRLKSFRDYALDGEISFRRGLAFSCYVFFYASLLFALGQYLYFRFLDNGAFLTLLGQTVEAMKPVYLQNGIKEQELATAMELVKQMKPTEWIFTFMTNNLFIGAIVSPLIALICKRSPKK